MASKIFVRIMIGLGCSAINTFVTLTILLLNDINVQVGQLWVNMLASIIIGTFFGVASFIFDYERWSPLKATVIHFFLSIIVFFPVAISVGWFPLKLRPLLLGLVMFIVIYAIFWLAMYYYFKKQTEALNASVKDRF
ncbi:DUF3021 domain-containing protein [Paenibacillus sp. L3-i20]|uniref:DUF3021 domain-containing protein n=1 Tax=Paenibacillus sp. L3-i20 TaxID=2905833 RepID=UPI001EDE4DFE|nr:DUF3021 domain-containing protein [Paenibacillus sp. L3-i20]GKU77513.1 hypothetical protein L3i20_v219100 [Paenibacillus sp. L3-i20]